MFPSPSSWCRFVPGKGIKIVTLQNKQNKKKKKKGKLSCRKRKKNPVLLGLGSKQIGAANIV